MAYSHTRQGQDLVTDVDGSIVLAFVERVLSPASQIFVHGGRVGGIEQ